MFIVPYGHLVVFRANYIHVQCTHARIEVNHLPSSNQQTATNKTTSLMAATCIVACGMTQQLRQEGSTRVKVAVKTQKTCKPGPVAITTLVMSLCNTP